MTRRYRQTPRPATPANNNNSDGRSSELSWTLNSSASVTSASTDRASSQGGAMMWAPVAAETTGKHRATSVVGWVSVPRSVVMATALNRKHEAALGSGKLSALADVANQRHARAVEVRARNRHRRTASAPVTGCREKREARQSYGKQGFYENVLEENLTQVGTLAQRVGAYRPERYKIIPPSSSDRDYAEDTLPSRSPLLNMEKTNTERALPAWKQTYAPPSTELCHYQQDQCLKQSQQQTRPASCHIRSKRRATRPFTADSSLRSQSDKASTASLLRPSTATATYSNYGARKSVEERARYKWEERIDKRYLLPAYPKRCVRNRPHVDHMTLQPGKRPVMTSDTNWFPLSFHAVARGRRIRVACDMFGYQSIAEYTELCHSLNDGLAAVEQPLEVGDSLKIKIDATDWRKDLLYCAVHKKPFDEVVVTGAETEHRARIPSNRLTLSAADWMYSDEVDSLKPHDVIWIEFDALGRIKCRVNEVKQLVLFQLRDSSPRLLALCLGLGVTKLQLLGCRKKVARLLDPDNAYEIVPGIHSEPDRPSPYFVYRPPAQTCSFCPTSDSNLHLTKSFASSCSSRLPPDGNDSDDEKENVVDEVDGLRVPYACDHIKICAECRRSVECKLCKAPLCWSTCPLCDTRLRGY